MTKNILVIDDHPETLRLISIILEREGYNVDTARTGAEGIQKAQTVIPHLVLLDIMMPGINGVDVCKQLREDNNTQVANATIVMFSARSLATDKEEAYAADADGYIVKPTRPSELLVLVKEYLANPREAASNSTTTDTPSHNTTVICSMGKNDSSSAIASNITAIVQSLGKTAVQLHSDALEQLESSVDESTEDVVIVDIGDAADALQSLLPHTNHLILNITHDVASIYAAKMLLESLMPTLSADTKLHVMQVYPAAESTIPAEAISSLLAHDVSLVVPINNDMIADSSAVDALTAWTKQTLGI